MEKSFSLTFFVGKFSQIYLLRLVQIHIFTSGHLASDGCEWWQTFRLHHTLLLVSSCTTSFREDGCLLFYPHDAVRWRLVVIVVMLVTDSGDGCDVVTDGGDGCGEVTDGGDGCDVVTRWC